jgi:hypothetical protein
VSFAVDYSTNYQHLDGIEDATYTPPGGAGVAVKVRQDSLRFSDLAGSVLGIAPGDIPFLVWLLGATDATSEAVLTVGAVSYRVIGAEIAPDRSVQRVICRKYVS